MSTSQITVLSLFERIVKGLDEAQQWQDDALNHLSDYRRHVDNASLRQLDKALREAIESNSHILNRVRQILEYGRARLRESMNPSSQSAQFPSASDFLHTPMVSAVQKFCQSYNAVIDNPQRKDDFLQHYMPIRLSVANAMERRRESSIQPVFQTTDDGSYYAVAIEGKAYYAVVPRFDLTFQESSYGPGAMGLVFECPHYNPRLRYRRVKAVKPALFEPDSTKQRWTFKAKGELELGAGE